jgi:hypothetical protein
MRLRGGMLYYTLFLMIISMTIVSLILLRGYMFRAVLTDSEKREEMNRDNNSALELYKEGAGVFKDNGSSDLDLYNDSLSFVEMRKKKWGVYDIISVTSTWKNLKISKTGLYGTDLKRGEPLALFLTDTGINLSLSGKSVLNGTCIVPGGIIRPASVEGYPFVYKKICIGKIKPSDKTLPPVDKEIQDSVQSLFYNIDTTNLYTSLIARGISDVVNQFSGPVVTYFGKSSYKSGNISMSGNIILACAGTMTITSSSTLDGIIVLARKIVIKEGFSGSLQAFALESVKVEKGVKLKYPSVLAIFQDKQKELTGDHPQISVDGNSTVCGCVLIATDNDSGEIVISKNAVVYGQVYCGGSVNLSGKVFGSVCCNSFRFTVSNSTYINHILNSDIDFSKMPEVLSGVEIGGQNKTRNLIKWLN